MPPDKTELGVKLTTSARDTGSRWVGVGTNERSAVVDKAYVITRCPATCAADFAVADKKPCWIGLGERGSKVAFRFFAVRYSRSFRFSMYPMSSGQWLSRCAKDLYMHLKN